MSQQDMWKIEQEYFDKGIELICGVDEAGRGPLAGPVCAAAVILPPNAEIPGLNDSKKLSDKKRRELYPIIKEQAIAYGIAFADHHEIDEINILQATYLAMERAINQLNVKPELAIPDSATGYLITSPWGIMRFLTRYQRNSPRTIIPFGGSKKARTGSMNPPAP